MGCRLYEYDFAINATSAAVACHFPPPLPSTRGYPVESAFYVYHQARLLARYSLAAHLYPLAEVPLTHPLHLAPVYRAASTLASQALLTGRHVRHVELRQKHGALSENESPSWPGAR